LRWDERDVGMSARPEVNDRNSSDCDIDALEVTGDLIVVTSA